VEGSFKHNFLKQKEIQIKKFSALKDLHQITATPKAVHGSEKFVINLSEHVLTESEESVLNRGLNFAVTNKVSDLGIVLAAESARSKLPFALSMKCCRFRCMLEIEEPFTCNITRKESMALKSLKHNKEIRILKLTKETAQSC
jgi:hypothetical protein